VRIFIKIKKTKKDIVFMSFEYTIQINNIKKSYDLKKANAVDKVFKKYFFSKDEHKKNIEKAMQNIF
jgi:hypothetical protein